MSDSQMSLFDAPVMPASPLLGSDPLTVLARQLTNWVELGWLRALDRHFVAFLQQHGEEDAVVLLSAAWASHQLGRGHICLELERALIDPDAVLSLPPQDGRALQFTESTLMPSRLLPAFGVHVLDEWLRRLAASPIVGSPDADNAEVLNDCAPLVLDGTQLYLRRLWRAEGGVAEGLAARMQQHDDVMPAAAEALDALFGPAPQDGVDEIGRAHV